MLVSDYTAKFLGLEDVIITGVENISDHLRIYIKQPRRPVRWTVAGRRSRRRSHLYFLPQMWEKMQIKSNRGATKKVTFVYRQR